MAMKVMKSEDPGGHGHSSAKDNDVLYWGGTSGDREEASWLSEQMNGGSGVCQE